MARLLQTLHPFPSLPPKKPPPLFSTRAVQPDKENTPAPAPPQPDDFDDRLNQVRLRYRSGTGKKAEVRKARKSGSPSSKKKGGGSGVFLPPVPLKDAVSDGLKVEFGFSPYTERLNGRLAVLGLAALLLVELGSGKSVLNYHAPATLLIQIYFVTTTAAVFVKYEKEKVSIWPETSKE